MTDKEIEKIIGMNQQLLILLGYATALLQEPDASKTDDEYWTKYNWLHKAIENVIYLNKPFPKMP